MEPAGTTVAVGKAAMGQVQGRPPVLRMQMLRNSVLHPEQHPELELKLRPERQLEERQPALQTLGVEYC